MKKTSIIAAAVLSLTVAGCSAKQNVDFSKNNVASISTVNSLYNLSEIAIEDGNYSESVNYLEELVVKDGNTKRSRIMFNYGMARTHLKMSSDYGGDFGGRQKNRDLALGYFEKVVELIDSDIEFNAYRLKSDSWVKYLSN